LLQGDDGDHNALTLSHALRISPPPPVARKLSNPSWKVIVSASLANTLSRALWSPAFFCEIFFHETAL
jgi:hypothetical protein